MLNNNHFIKVEVNSGIVLNESIQSKMQITEQTNTHLIFKLKENQKPNDILKILLQNNVEISGMTEILPTINEIFIQSVNNNS